VSRSNLRTERRKAVPYVERDLRHRDL